MNIAICGASCTGKSTLAKLLAAQLDCEIRNCGSLVRESADRRRVAVEALPLCVHKEIDTNTLLIANTLCDGYRIIEGRYLRYVLSNCIQPIAIIELTASVKARLARWQKRLQVELDHRWLQSLDQADIDFMEKMYRNIVPRTPIVTIDTAENDTSICLNLMMQFLKTTCE